MKPPRAHAADLIAQILRDQGSLSSLLPTYASRVLAADRPLLQQLCFGVCRYYPKLSCIIELLVEKPLRNKDLEVQALLLLGLYQLIYTRIPDHAAIGETVEAARHLNKPWATKLLNAVLRNYQRDADALAERLSGNELFQTNHPEWLWGMLNKSWPEQSRTIVAANDEHPPFTLRVNINKMARDEYLELLADVGMQASATTFSPYGVTLSTPCDPRELPGFDQGLVSVQDEAAQLAPDLLSLAPQLRVLDACAAPGGKTGHLLEREASLHVTAIDIEQRRLTRVRENLDRLGVSADIRVGDGTEPSGWWNGELYDRILLDAPCSATGILRRHPDIKVLRQPDDIARLSELQGRLLDSLWPLLKPDGILVYATCSVLPRENTRVVSAFCARTPSASLLPIDAEWGIDQPAGRQLLPVTGGHDGFYYARLMKTTNN